MELFERIYFQKNTNEHQIITVNEVQYTKVHTMIIYAIIAQVSNGKYLDLDLKQIELIEWKS